MFQFPYYCPWNAKSTSPSESVTKLYILEPILFLFKLKVLPLIPICA
jgi:hypothetical protein